jgi:hypothetical protein
MKSNVVKACISKIYALLFVGALLVSAPLLPKTSSSAKYEKFASANQLKPGKYSSGHSKPSHQAKPAKQEKPSKQDKEDKHNSNADKVSESELEHLLNILKRETEALANSFKVKVADLTAKGPGEVSRSFTTPEMVEELRTIKSAVSTLNNKKNPSACRYIEKVNPVLDDLISIVQSRKCQALERDSKKVSSLLTQIRRLLHTLNEKVSSGFSELETSVEEIAGDISGLQLTIDSRLDVIEDTLDDCCFSLESKLDNLTVSASCDVSSISSKLDDCCFSLESKLDNLTVSASCSASCDFGGTFTVLAAIESILETCCSSLGDSLFGLNGNVTGGFNTVNSKLDECCFNLESKLDNLTVSASCDLTLVESKLDDCCFSLESKLDNLSCSASACAPTPVTGPTTITTSGIYCLAQNIIYSGILTPNPVIAINTSNVVLDLNGYSIEVTNDSAPGLGIGTNSTINSDIIIKNGSIIQTSGSKTHHGIDMNFGGNNILLEKLVITGWSIGIFENGVNGLHINEINATNNGTGLQISCGNSSITQSNGNTIRNSIFNSNSANGVTFVTCSDFIFDECHFDNNSNNGISITGGMCIEFYNCSAIGNTGLSVSLPQLHPAGFYVQDSADFVIKSCFACSNAGDGFLIQAATANTSGCIFNSTAKANSMSGFETDSTAPFMLDLLAQGNTSFENDNGYDNSATGTQQYFTNVAFNNTANNYTGSNQNPPFFVNGLAPVSASSANNYWQNVHVP